jgi:hypothetical protein
MEENGRELTEQTEMTEQTEKSHNIFPFVPSSLFILSNDTLNRKPFRI